MDDEWLYRRVYPDFIDWDHRDDDGRPRVKSGAFQDYGDKQAADLGYEAPAMSVALRSVMQAQAVEALQLLAGFHETYGLVAITAGEARAAYQGVMRRPTEGEPWHGIVFDKTSRRRRPAAQRALAIAASLRWIVVPSDPDLSKSSTDPST